MVVSKDYWIPKQFLKDEITENEWSMGSKNLLSADEAKGLGVHVCAKS